MSIDTDEWAGCYGDGWQGVITEESFAHPAKFSRKLISRIYAHLKDCGRIAPGMTVLDPFGGVALGALDAMFHGLSWVGCELEYRFHQMGLENIALWNDRYKGWPGWGRATLLNGDSRKLSEVLKGADCLVSSPPYAKSETNGVRENRAKNLEAAGIDSKAWLGNKRCTQGRSEGYGVTEGQLGALKEAGGVDAVLSSPPFENCAASVRDVSRNPREYEVRTDAPQPGQIGNYLHEHRTAAGLSLKDVCEQGGFYGNVNHGGACSNWEAGLSLPTKDQWLKLKQILGLDDRFDRQMCSVEVRRSSGATLVPEHDSTKRLSHVGDSAYGESDGQLGSNGGETFWQAARVIVAQCFSLLRPGGIACWVAKDFVRNRAVVPFSDQWRRLCEAIGFRTLHEHHALLVSDGGTQAMLFGEPEKLTKERKSFFRRLAEKKGSPRIDWETVWCMEKPDA